MAARWYPGWGLALLRVVLGLIFLVHGWDKLFGSGVGAFTEFLVFEGWAWRVASVVPAAGALAWLVTMLEFLGGLLLLVGWATRWIAVPLFFEVLVALFAVHVENGFFVFEPYGEWGYEYHLVLLAGLGCLFLAGGGNLSVDDWYLRRAPMIGGVEG